MPRHLPATFPKKARRSRNLTTAQALVRQRVAFHDAKTKMPIIYTEDDFVFITLHGRSAGPISISVTSRERVGRSMVDVRQPIESEPGALMGIDIRRDVK
jgi:hypothetical protein